jgi:transposase
MSELMALASDSNTYARYSLVQTAEHHAVNPLAYLEDVRMLVQTHPAARIDELLPDHWNPPDR